MPTIKNENYRRFLDEGILNTLGPEQIDTAINNVAGMNKEQGICLICALYLTGARPNEVIKLLAKHITMDGSHYVVALEGSKGGLPRRVYFSQKNKYAGRLWRYANQSPPDLVLFWPFKNSYTRRALTKNGEVRIYEETTNKVYYWVKKWFSHIEGGINPYLLRHNRFSKLAMAGADLQQIRLLKGSRTIESVIPYLHMSVAEAKKLSRLVD